VVVVVEFYTIDDIDCHYDEFGEHDGECDGGMSSVGDLDSIPSVQRLKDSYLPITSELFSDYRRCLHRQSKTYFPDFPH